MGKELFQKSRIILVLLTVIICSIGLINADKSVHIFIVIMSLFVYMISYPSTIVSKFIIKIGNKINNIFLKVSYYLLLPLLIFIIFLLIYGVALYIFEFLPEINDLAAGLGQAISMLLIVALLTTCFIVPYVQSIIVLFLNTIEKINKRK